jgi:hypothetical protein
MVLTVPTGADVHDFLKSAPRSDDALALCKLMAKATGAQPTMWGSSIVGFGTYHYVYASGRTGDWPAVAFSPRKANLTLYITHGFDEYAELLAEIGPYITGKGCLYIKRLSAVDAAALGKLVKSAYKARAGKTIQS